MVILIWSGAKVALGCLISLRLVEIFSAQTEAIGRQFLDASFRIILRCAVGLEFVRNAKDGQILVLQEEEAGLDLLEHFFAKLANESVIILALNVNHELFVARLCALRQGHHFLKSNRSLENYKNGEIVTKLVK